MPANYLNEIFGLKGKTAVVIGGTGVLCGAMAEGLAKAGAAVALVGRNREKAEANLKAIRGAGGTGFFAPADATKKEDLKKVLERVLEKTGGADILVNGAGINSTTPFLEIEEEEFQNIMDTNLKAILFSAQVFGGYFLEQGKGGSIINIGSMSGMIPLSRVFAYSASKAAVHNLSKNLAREWAEAGIRVNTLVPGFFPAEQNRKILTPERVADIMGHTPANRFGEASELIGAVLFLASEKASSFVTGAEIVVDGGYSAMTI